MSTPIRTYITEYKESLRNVALFSTGDSEEPKVVEEMEQLIGGYFHRKAPSGPETGGRDW